MFITPLFSIRKNHIVTSRDIEKNIANEIEYWKQIYGDIIVIDITIPQDREAGIRQVQIFHSNSN